MKLIDQEFKVKRTNGAIDDGFKIIGFDIIPEFGIFSTGGTICVDVLKGKIKKQIPITDLNLYNPQLKDFSKMSLSDIYEYFYEEI
jgi:hypothetical protein